MIQNLTKPSQCAIVKIDDRSMEFVSFVDYQNLSDIGFIDKKVEGGDKVAFITRRIINSKGLADKNQSEGDIILNVLEIDSYSKIKMTFKFFSTEHKVNMDEGMSDDSIVGCFSIQIQS